MYYVTVTEGKHIPKDILLTTCLDKKCNSFLYYFKAKQPKKEKQNQKKKTQNQPTFPCFEWSQIWIKATINILNFNLLVSKT